MMKKQPCGGQRERRDSLYQQDTHGKNERHHQLSRTVNAIIRSGKCRSISERTSRPSLYLGVERSERADLCPNIFTTGIP